MSTIPSYPHDLWSDEALLDPYPHYEALRELGPVVWLEAHEMYALPRYAEARAVLINAGGFCSGQGVGLNEMVNTLGAGTTLMSDGELHRHLRSVIAPGLTARRMQSIRDDVQRLAHEQVAGLVARGSFDAVTDLAQALPLKIVPDLLGWPEDGREHLLEWASATFDVLGPMNARAQQGVPKLQEMMEFAARIAAEGDIAPGGVGVAILDAARRGEIEASQVPPLLIDYLGPSLDTTISAISNAVWLLADHPDQWAALRADRGLIANTFNEAVRLESPIRAFTRVTAGAEEIGGCEIPSGARVLVLYGSANRDGRVFERADEFLVSRRNAVAHIGFGHGTHGCVGQGLARLEGEAVLGALVDQVDLIYLGQPQRSLNNLINSWASVPVTVQPR